MAQDFESEFENIINNNSFDSIDEDGDEELEMDEVAHVLECINETSLIIASSISEALETKTPITYPAAAVAIFRALHAFHEEFISLLVAECECEDCQQERDDD